LHSVSLGNVTAVSEILRSVRPDECYHLGAQTFVNYSSPDEFSTLNSNISGVHHLLSGIRSAAPECRFFFAGSSEMFGRADESPQNERTALHPRSVYGISKVTGFELTRHYRESYSLHASTGILYNHESPRRGREFVTRKITSGLAAIVAGRATELRLGNLDAERDWGHAREYVEAMWLMLQQDSPEDYVIATGHAHTVREFTFAAFEMCGLDPNRYIVIDPAFFRPLDGGRLVGDATKASQRLRWRATTTLNEIVTEMVEADCRSVGVPLPESIARA